MKKIFMILSILAIGLNLYAAEKTKIIWHMNDWPPYYFKTDEMKGKGEAGAATYQAIKLLPEYEHEIRFTPSKRVYALMKQQENHCKSGLFKNEKREEYMYFAKHNQYYFPYGITIHKKNFDVVKPFLNEENYIDLNQALASGKLTLAINISQSYGKNLDAILEKYKNSKNIINTTSGEKMREALLRRLFTSNRYQATLAIPEEINYHAKQQELDGNQLLYFPVIGTKLFGPGWWGYIGCSKSKLGKEIIAKINQHIDAIRAVSVARYRDFLDENAKKIHEKAEKKVFQ